MTRASMRPASGAWAETLARPLADRIAPVLGVAAGALRMAPLGEVVQRPDASAVFRVGDGRSAPRVVLLCAPPDAPDMVARGMQRARIAKGLIGPGLDQHILDPLAEGRIGGLSYALLPHCAALVGRGVAWRVQCVLLRPVLFDWLYQVCAATVRSVDEPLIEWRFAAPLVELASLTAIDEPVRSAARLALQRLNDGLWQPRTVLMHGDLWKGNVLLRAPQGTADRLRWRERFVVIDWPGSEAQGHAIFDLVRLAQSVRSTRVALRAEVERHCALLHCDRLDAMSYLLAALGHMATRLGHFPMESFARMVQGCHASLADAMG